MELRWRDGMAASCRSVLAGTSVGIGIFLGLLVEVVGNDLPFGVELVGPLEQRGTKQALIEEGKND